MTNQEAIKFLKQLYPNGGCCWLDEQRIEAISMAISALGAVKIGETTIELEDDGDEEPYTQRWLDISCMEHEIPKGSFCHGDKVEVLLRRKEEK